MVEELEWEGTSGRAQSNLLLQEQPALRSVEANLFALAGSARGNNESLPLAADVAAGYQKPRVVHPSAVPAGEPRRSVTCGSLNFFSGGTNSCYITYKWMAKSNYLEAEDSLY